MKIDLTQKETNAVWLSLSHSLMDLEDTEERELIESVMEKLDVNVGDSEQ